MKTITILLRAFFVLLIAGALSATSVSPGSARLSAPRTPQQVAEAVLLSADPHASFLALDGTERAIFLEGFRNQTSVVTESRYGTFIPSAAQLAQMTTARAPAHLRAAAQQRRAGGCWYKYWEKAWYDLGIHDGDSWMQLNWCGSNGSITSWSQSNVGCAGYHGASCSVASKAERNVGWEIRSSRYFNANFFGFSNTFCMQIRGGATGLYSTRSSNDGICSLN